MGVVWAWFLDYGRVIILNFFPQAKFMPQTNNSVLVSASRDGQVRRHVISGSGELVATDKVAYHSDSAHKVIRGNFREYMLCWEPFYKILA